MSEFPFLVPLNDKENMSTPIQNESKLQSTVTPNENKVSHPIIKNLIVKRSNSMINESFFSEAEATPSYSNFLSPDLVGGLFPTEINTNQLNMERIENICKTFRDNDSSNITCNDSILPSPCIADSGFGSMKLETFSISRSLSVPVTPPSNFKWNRKEYRSNHLEESVITDEESNDEYIPERNHFESTQIFDDETCLADNVSMRRLSRIGFKTTNSSGNTKSFKGKQLKSFVNSKINNSSGISSFGESWLSINNTNSNENHNKETNRFTPYYRSSPSKPQSSKIQFNLDNNSPFANRLSIINKGILKENWNLSPLNNSNEFSNSIIEINSPILNNSFKRYDLNGSFIVPKLHDLDISPINSDSD